MKSKFKFQYTENSPAAFGGVLNLGKRKISRPVRIGIPTHLVLKAVDSETLLPHAQEIEAYIRRLTSKFNIRLLEFAVQPDHAHMLPVIQDSKIYRRWIRALTGNISRRFKIRWKVLPFTSPVETADYCQNVKKYIRKNKREGEFIRRAHATVENWILAHWPL